MRARGFYALALCLVTACACASEAPDDYRRMADFHHTAWTSEEGSPGDTWVTAQTPDGWLWLGGPRGLFRFDGIEFEHVELEGRDPRQPQAVRSLFASESGELWIGYVYGGASCLSKGTFRHFGTAEGMPATSVFAIAHDRSGTIWAGGAKGLLRFNGQRWERKGPVDGFTDQDVINMYLDRSGTLWIAGDKNLFYLARGESQIQASDVALNGNGSTDFMQSPDGRAWYGNSDGIWLLPRQVASVPYSSPIDPGMALGSLFDRDGSLWTIYPTLRKFRVPEGSTKILFGDYKDAEQLTEKNGLTAPNVNSVMQDREGNIWTATRGGIDRFRRTNVRRLNLTGDTPKSHAIAAADDGALWIGMGAGNVTYPNDGLWKFDGRLSRMAAGVITDVTAAERDANGAMWFGGDRGLWRLEGSDRFTKLPELPTIARNKDIHGLTVDADGNPWVTVVNSGLYRLHDGAWQLNGSLSALPLDQPLVQTRDRLGRVWFGYRDSRLAVVQADKVQLYGAENGLRVGQVSAIGVGRYTVVAGERRIALLNHGRFHMLHDIEDNMALEGVTGIVETGSGDVWLNGFRGAVRIAAHDLEKALRTQVYTVPVEIFDAEDGFPGIAQPVRPLPTLIAGTDGHLWLAGTLGTGMIDPSRLNRNAIPPSLAIRSVMADNHTYRATAKAQLPKGTHNLQVNYTALSLMRPERIRFRYRLDGYDETWVEAGARRQAFYTNLGPGEYRFRVIAANESGLWNNTGASLKIVIPPTFTQTRTFLVLSVLAAIALLWAAYALRVKQVTARERSRLEERLRERERIARELHDTFLQGVQGLILRFHTVADQIPAHEKARASMEQALDRADSLLIEGRDRVKNLRGADSPPSLQQAMLSAGEQMSADHSARLLVMERGTPRELHPVVWEEATRIGIEAMFNAFRHADAATIEVEISYERRQLRIAVRDDGNGMEESVVREGREGHFGFIGMRERAQRIRGRISVWSRPGAGTEVSLVVPASMAYVRARQKG